MVRRLHARSEEVERAFARACTASEPGGMAQADRAGGQKEAASELVRYTIGCIAEGRGDSVPVPSVLIARVRQAARDGVALDAVLVKLIAAHAFFNEFVLGEAGDGPAATMCRVQSLQGSILLRLVTVLTREYKNELERDADSAHRRRTALMERLLTGLPADPADLHYPFEGWHVALVATGPRAMVAARLRAEGLGGSLLAVRREPETVWAWVGSRKPPSMDRVRAVVESGSLSGVRLAVGGPGEGLQGWRSSHFEARATSRVASRMPQAVTYFSQVALEAMALQAPDLARSLRAIYLPPLAQRSRGAATLRQTLSAYFAAGRNASSAASALNVTRRTVENRLRAVEEKLGQSLTLCGAEVELALRLERLKEADPSAPV